MAKKYTAANFNNVITFPKSGTIQALRYDSARMVLEVRFRSNPKMAHRFYGVDPYMVDGFFSGSPGRHFNQAIKGQYRTRRLPVK